MYNNQKSYGCGYPNISTTHPNPPNPPPFVQSQTQSQSQSQQQHPPYPGYTWQQPSAYQWFQPFQPFQPFAPFSGPPTHRPSYHPPQQHQQSVTVGYPGCAPVRVDDKKDQSTNDKHAKHHHHRKRDDKKKVQLTDNIKDQFIAQGYIVEELEDGTTMIKEVSDKKNPSDKKTIKDIHQGSKSLKKQSSLDEEAELDAIADELRYLEQYSREMELKSRNDTLRIEAEKKLDQKLQTEKKMDEMQKVQEEAQVKKLLTIKDDMLADQRFMESKLAELQKEALLLKAISEEALKDQDVVKKDKHHPQRDQSCIWTKPRDHSVWSRGSEHPVGRWERFNKDDEDVIPDVFCSLINCKCPLQHREEAIIEKRSQRPVVFSSQRRCYDVEKPSHRRKDQSTSTMTSDDLDQINLNIQNVQKDVKGIKNELKELGQNFRVMESNVREMGQNLKDFMTDFKNMYSIGIIKVDNTTTTDTPQQGDIDVSGIYPSNEQQVDVVISIYPPQPDAGLVDPSLQHVVASIYPSQSNSLQVIQSVIDDINYPSLPDDEYQSQQTHTNTDSDFDDEYLEQQLFALLQPRPSRIVPKQVDLNDIVNFPTQPDADDFEEFPQQGPKGEELLPLEFEEMSIFLAKQEKQNEQNVPSTQNQKSQEIQEEMSIFPPQPDASPVTTIYNRFTDALSKLDEMLDTAEVVEQQLNQDVMNIEEDISEHVKKLFIYDFSMSGYLNSSSSSDDSDSDSASDDDANNKIDYPKLDDDDVNDHDNYQYYPKLDDDDDDDDSDSDIYTKIGYTKLIDDKNDSPVASQTTNVDNAAVEAILNGYPIYPLDFSSDSDREVDEENQDDDDDELLRNAIRESIMMSLSGQDKVPVDNSVEVPIPMPQSSNISIPTTTNTTTTTTTVDEDVVDETITTPQHDTDDEYINIGFDSLIDEVEDGEVGSVVDNTNTMVLTPNITIAPNGIDITTSLTPVVAARDDIITNVPDTPNVLINQPYVSPSPSIIPSVQEDNDNDIPILLPQSETTSAQNTEVMVIKGTGVIADQVEEIKAPSVEGSEDIETVNDKFLTQLFKQLDVFYQKRNGLSLQLKNVDVSSKESIAIKNKIKMLDGLISNMQKQAQTLLINDDSDF